MSAAHASQNAPSAPLLSQTPVVPSVSAADRGPAQQAADAILARWDEPEELTEDQIRLNELRRLRVMDTAPEATFDTIVAIARRAFDVPMASISLVEQERQWFKAKVGVEVCETARDISACTHAIRADEVLVVPDLSRDARFADNPLVTGEAHLRFYAGAPISVGDGVRIGTVCVIDTEPRLALDEGGRATLAGLADLAAALLEAQASVHELAVTQARMRDFSEIAADLFWETDCDHRFTYISAALGDGAQHPYAPHAGDLIGCTRWEVAEAAEGDWDRHIADLEARRPFRDLRYSRETPDGCFHFSVAGRPVHDEAGMFIGYRGTSKDVTDEQKAHREALDMAHKDPLTGLPNRRHWQSRLERAVGRANADTSKSAVLLIDLDHFKEVNDSLGHAVGDQLLMEVAGRIQTCLREEDMAARLGGDEFAVLLTGIGRPDEADVVARRILEALGQPCTVEGNQLHPQGSVGIALLPQDAETASDLMVAADLALYRAKDEGRGRHAFFSAELRDEVERRADASGQFGRAMADGEFELHYQPQIRLDDRRVSGMEALLRWRHPERGLLPPAAFLDALETSAFNQEVGEWVIDEACAQAARWRDAGTPVRVGVNISPGQMQAGNLPEIVAAALQKHGLSGDLLEIEITERVILRRDSDSMDALQKMRDLGVSVAFDDFGTGFASLSTLRDCPLDRVKIDRGFISHVGRSSRDASIARALLTMCRGMGLNVTAEGVEETGHEAFLMLQGCEEAQGYRYGKPMTATEAGGVLAGQDVDLTLLGEATARRADGG